jgi:hypothetical protein
LLLSGPGLGVRYRNAPDCNVRNDRVWDIHASSYEIKLHRSLPSEEGASDVLIFSRWTVGPAFADSTASSAGGLF